MLKRILYNIDRMLVSSKPKKAVDQSHSEDPVIDVLLLEDRVLYSAVPLVEPTDLQGGDPNLVGDTSDSDCASCDTTHNLNDEQGPSAQDAGQAESLDEASEDYAAGADSVRRELVFLDENVENFSETLDQLLSIDDPKRDIDIVILNSYQDGVEQISQTLACAKNLDAVHIISDESSSALGLGSSVLDGQSMEGYAGNIAQWPDALSTNGSLYLYGSAAPLAEASELQEAMEALTAVDVAYSDDLGPTLLDYEGGEDDGLFDLDSINELDLSQPIEVIIVDAGVDNADQLLSGLRESADGRTQWVVIELSADADGVAQITDALDQLSNVDAVHLVSHGDGEGLQLGNTELTLNSANNQYLDQIQSWANALDADADLLIYGCDLASTDAGQQLIQSIADAVDCDVAASDDVTGHEDLGGDWVFEHFVGEITTEVAFNYFAQNSWYGSLGSIVVDTTGDVSDGDTSSLAALMANKGADGYISLREAIEAANNSTGADSISFNIAGSGTQVINLASALPAINDTIYIDGTTQTGWVAGSYMPIVIDGDNNGTGLVFTSTADNSVLRGVIVRDFDDDAIDILDGADNITIAGNWIGQFNSDGSDAGVGNNNSWAGIRSDGDNVTIGGTTVADRNVISGNTYGIELVGTTTGTTIAGNYIGTNISGTATHGSTDYGIYLANDSSFNTIGGATSASANVIAGTGISAIHLTGVYADDITIQNNYIGVSADGTTNLGNDGDGIRIYGGGDDAHILDNIIAGSGDDGIQIDGNGQGSTRHIIQGNIIGTDFTGTYDWGVGNHGIVLESYAHGNTIGGTGVGEGNIIAFSGHDLSQDGAGITVLDSNSTDNTIRGNSIFENRGLGIDLGATSPDGTNGNDAGDGDSGGNTKENWAVLNAAAINDAGDFSYDLDTTTLAAGTYTIDFYASTDRDGGQVEGRRYLGSLTGVANGSSSLTGSLSGITLSPGEYVVLTATDTSGNTSEFSNYAVATDSDAGGASPSTLVATATNDGGLSLNENGGNDVMLQADDGGALVGGLTSLTMEFQFRSDGVEDSPAFLSYAVDGQHNELALFADLSDNELLLFVGGNSVGTGIYFDNLADGQLHSIAISWDNAAGNWAFYVDGTQVSSGTGLSTGDSITAGGNLVIGNDQDAVRSEYSTNQEFTGRLYDVRLFNDVRTSGEVSANCFADLDYDTANLIANWKFNEVSTDGVVTDTVSGNNLSIEHIAQSGFTTATGELNFEVDEYVADGTVIGTVTAIDPEREALIASLLAADPDLVYSAETGKFYKAIDASGTWNTASTAALGTSLNGADGQLATIRSATEQAIAASLAASSGNHLWLGASDQTVEGEHRWQQDGADADQFWSGDETGNSTDGAYSNWLAGRPDNSGGAQNWVHIRTDGFWNEEDSAYTTGGYLVEWDADEVLDVTQAISYSIQSQTVNGAFAIDASTGEITVADGSLVDFETSATYTLNVEVTDVDGNTYTQAVEVDVNNRAQDPEHVVPITTQNVVEDGTLTFSSGNGNAITVTDSSASSNINLQIELSVSQGTLTLSQTTGLTIIEGADGSATMTIQGSESDINAALEGLQYSPTADYNGADSLTVTTSMGVDLEGLYTFEGGSAADQAAETPQDGTFNGDATVINDPERGDVLQLDGMGDSVEISGMYGNPANVTIAAWIKPTIGSDSEIISLGDSFAMRLTNSGELQVFYWDGAAHINFFTGVSIDSNWNHVAASFDDTGNSLKVFVNGTQIGDYTVSNSISYTLGSNSTIGNHGDGETVYDFTGLIDEARVYSRALSADEIGAIFDGQGETTSSVSINVTPVNDAPVEATIEGSAISYTENDGAVAISSTLTLSDVDDANLESAVVQVTGNYVNGQDVLAFTNQNGISGSWNATTGTLTLTGTASVADYETALRSLTYTNSSDNPNTATRTISFTVNDGDTDSNTVTRDIGITAVNDAPINTVPGTQSVAEETTTAISGISITDADDNGSTMTTRLQVSNGVLNITLSGSATISSGANGSGDLTIQGTAADINATLASLTYTGDTDVTGVAADTLTVTTNDGGNTGTGGAVQDTDNIQIDITNINDAPVEATIEGSALTYTENDGAVAITSTLTLSDVDDTNLESAVVQITGNYVNGQDVLAFTNQNGISGSWNATTGTLTLTGTASVADYQTALRSITYTNSSDNPNTATRTVSFTVNDGDTDSNTTTRDIGITAVNDAPVEASIEGSTLSYTENDGAVAITSTLALSDLDDTNLESAVIQVTGNYFNGQDVLAFTDQNGISGSWNATTGTLTLTGTASVADYEAALRSVTYTNSSDNPNTATRTISFTVNDGDTDSNTVTRDIGITAVNDAPINTVPGTQSVAEETTTAISGISISDADDNGSTMTTRLQVSNGVLNITLSGGATISSGANGSGDLTIQGTAADINATLASLTYTGDTDVTGVAADTLTVTTNDGGNTGTGGALQDTDNIQIDITNINDAPVEATIEGSALTYTENDGAVSITSTLTLSDVDDTNLESAVVQITGSYVNGQDVLAFTNQNGISGSWNSTTGTLTLTGTASVADYEAALRSVTYTNNSDNPNTATRTISFTVNDGDTDSNTVTRDIGLTAVNDAPINTVPGTQSVAEETTTAISGISIADVDANTNTMTTRLQVSNGVLNITLSGSASISSGANGSGDLTIQGTAADINATLASLTYTGDTDVTGVAADTLTVTTNDGGNTGTGGALQDTDNIQIDITPVNDAPVEATIEGSALSYTENDGAVAITSTLTLSDVDDTNLESAVVQITGNYVNGQDVLAFTNQNGISGSWNATTGTLTLTGTASVADYEAALRSVTYTNSSDNPNTATRTISFTVNDGDTDSNTVTRDIGLTAVNDAPINTVPGTQSVAEETTTAISGISISDADDNGSTMTTRLQVSNGVLNITLSGSASISSGANGSGDLTIQGTAADINATLASLTYTGDTDVTGVAADTLTVTTNDGGNTGTGGALQDTDNIQIDITNLNDAPVEASIEGSALSYTENDGAVAITSTLALSDLDDTNLESAVIQVSSNYVNGQDVLAFTNQNGISGSWNATTGTLSLTGTASVADYEAALRSVTYTNSSDNPNTATRTVSFTVNDGDADSNTVTRAIGLTAVNDAPINTVPGTQSVAEETTTAITGISITDVDDNGSTMTTRLQVSNGVLNITLSGSASISSGANGSGDLTIQGTAADINATLASLTYTGDTDVTGVAADTLTVTTNDSGNTGTGGALQDTDNIQIDITNINDAPVEATIEGSALSYTENDGAVAITSTLTLSDVDDTNLESAVVQITGSYVNGQDVLAFTNQNGISGSWNATTGTLTLTGTASVADYEAALRSVTYTNNSDNPNTATRTISFTVNDGDADSNTVTRDIGITAVNDAPVEASIEGSTLSYTENDGAVAITSTLALSDLDDTNLESAVIQVTGNYFNGQDVLAFTNQNGISGSWNATTGTLTLTGTASVADYETALRSITYTNSSDNPNTATRTISFTVNDGDTDSNTVTRDIGLTAVNDAPINTVPGTQSVAEETTTAISGISITDADDNGSTMTTRLQVSNGVLNITLSGSATISSGANGSGDLTIQGTAADINATLASLTYTGNTNVTGVAADTLTVTTNDGGNTGTGGALQDTDNIQIDITNINDAPVEASIEGSALSYTENDGAVAITSTLALSDLDDTNLESAVIQVSSNYVNGQDVLAFTNQNGISGSWNATTGTLTLTGTASVADYESALRSVTYTNSSDDPNTVTRTISFTVNDGDADSNILTRDVDVSSVNDDPFNAGSLPTGVATLEDVWSPIDLSAMDLDDLDAGASHITLKLQTSAGGNLSANPSTGITISGNGSNLVQMTGTVTDLNNYLDVTTNLRYLHPTPDINGSAVDTLTLIVNDNGNTGSGGGNDIVLGVANVDIVNVNDAPTAVDDSYTLGTDPLSVSLVQGILANDADIDGDAVTVSLVSGPASGTLILNADGSFLYAPGSSFASEVSFSYVCDDGTTTSNVATVTITREQVIGLNIPTNSDDRGGNDDGVDDIQLLSEPIDTTRPGLKPSGNDQPSDETRLADGPSNQPSGVRVDFDKLSGKELDGDEHDDGYSLSDDMAYEAINVHDPRFAARNYQFQASDFVGLNMSEMDKLTIAQLQYALEQFEQDAIHVDKQAQVVSGTASGLFIGATAAGTAWLVSGSSLLAILASSVPAWASFDPVYVVTNRRTVDKDDSSVADLIQQASPEKLSESDMTPKVEAETNPT